MSKKYDYPVWTTSKGGLAKEFHGTGSYIFIQKPNVSYLDVGNLVPKGLGLVPANKFAREQ